MIKPVVDSTVDVAIVGGGPGGCWAAKECADRGLETVLFEKDPDIGAPVRCAEGVGVMGLKEFYEPDPLFVRQTLSNYLLVAPDGSSVKVCGEDHGYVLDRKVFDKKVAEDAAAAGARIVTDAHVNGAHRRDDRYVLELAGGDLVEARLVIGADGTESRVGRWWGLKTDAPPHDMESGAQYLLGNLDVDEDLCQIWFGSNVAPGGYFWVFPKGNRTANVGLGISGQYSRDNNPFEFLDRMIATHFPNASRLGRMMGGISCTGGVKDFVADGLMLVGDAAHQANPLTGGGIINAMKAARIAAGVAEEAIRSGDTSKKVLKKYQSEWDSSWGKTGRRYYRLKEWVFGLPDERINAISKLINGLEPDQRTLRQIFKAAAINQPRLLLDVARLAF